ncbi:phytoene desaturase family protein [Amycolatopsis anabasis]|uniref:phytoene desaturase family protein n=1 Tax=Amycolatopsis anabasis TaxID=1840409 RepID=UPI0024846002|nr:NAD(P)/FAD-dependent oxidoreductase [Amycolatopsis anabasis]
MVVVGSGPNGLAAAVLMARAGLAVELREAAAEIGGGLRSVPLFDSEVVHDICSAVHPLAVAGRFFREFDLGARGVELRQPEIAYAHPLDHGRAGLAYRSLARTCARLGADGANWRRLMAPLVERSRGLVDLLFSDQRRIPGDLLAPLLLPARILAHGTPLARRAFGGAEAAALLAGVAGHSFARLPSLPGGAVALLLGHLAHATGWPVPVGGSRSIAAALADDFLAHGGVVRTGSPVTDLRELARVRAVLLDLAPRGLLELAGPLLPGGYRRRLEAYRYGPGAAKVDFLVSEPIPWAAPEVGEAGTVHVCGDQAEVFAAESAVASGRRADRPFVLVADPMVVDPSRGRPGKRPVWAYCHVPNGDERDPTEAIRRQIERFAPGFSDTVLASRAITAAEFAAYNANYVGGDIAAGAITVRQLLARPTPRWDPYRTALGGVYLCSAATPPGPGVHGMSGYFAARSALRREFGIRTTPGLAP